MCFKHAKNFLGSRKESCTKCNWNFASLKLIKFHGTSQWLYRINLYKQSSCTIYSRRTMNYVVMCSHGARCIRNFQNNDYRLFIYVAYIVTASNFPIESNFLNSQRQKPLEHQTVECLIFHLFRIHLSSWLLFQFS